MRLGIYEPLLRAHPLFRAHPAANDVILYDGIARSQADDSVVYAGLEGLDGPRIRNRGDGRTLPHGFETIAGSPRN